MLHWVSLWINNSVLLMLLNGVNKQGLVIFCGHPINVDLYQTVQFVFDPSLTIMGIAASLASLYIISLEKVNRKVRQPCVIYYHCHRLCR